MKKLVILLVVLSLLMPVSFLPVVLAQEPTVEPTEEPTAEPTEEPTVEPTEAPTAEPTEEPTVEPTEAPTAEPTEEPTVEPTEAPTPEPTEEPTVEPTEAPTPTPVPTSTPVPTVEPAGPHAAATYNTTTMFYAQNVDTTQQTLQVSIYTVDSSTAIYNDSPTFNPGYAKVYDQGSMSLSGFTHGSAVIASGGPVAAVVLEKGMGSPNRFDTYASLPSTEASASLALPQIMRNYRSLGYYWNNLIVIQNTSSDTNANVTINFSADYAGNSANLNFSPIEPQTSEYINTSDLTSLGTFYGSATLTSNVPVVAMVNLQTDGSLLCYKGFAGGATPGSGEIFTGLLYKHIQSYGYDYNSAIMVKDVSGSGSTVRVKYYPSSGIPSQYPGGSPWSYDITLSPGEMRSIDQRYDMSITTGTYYGTASLEALSGEIVAISNIRATGTYQPVSSVAVGGSSVTKVAVPVVYKEHSMLGYSWSTAVGVMNLSGTDATVRVTYYPFSGGSSIQYDTTVSANSSINIDQRYDTHISTSTFEGSMTVESLTGQNILALVNLRGLGGTGDNQGSYVGPPIQ